MKNKQVEVEWVTVAEAASELNYSREYIRQLARDGKLASRKVGPTVTIDIAELRARHATTGGKTGSQPRTKTK